MSQQVQQDLFAEIQQLKIELDQVNSLKFNSAQFGLTLFKENIELTTKVAELEDLNERISQELKLTENAMKKLKLSQRVTCEENFQQVEFLLNESNVLEESLTQQITEAEADLRQVKRELKLVTEERDNIIQEKTEITEEKVKIQTDIIQLKNQLKEFKKREEILLSKNEELEENNTLLQSQISTLRNSEKEFKVTEEKIYHLLEENEVLHSTIEELKTIAKIAETRMDELQQIIQYEREDKAILKREIDLLQNSDSISIITNLADSIKAIENTATEDDKFLMTACHETDNENRKMDILTQILNELKTIGSRMNLFETGKFQIFNKRSAEMHLQNEGNEIKGFLSEISNLTKQIGEVVSNFENSYKSRSSLLYNSLRKKPLQRSKRVSTSFQHVTDLPTFSNPSFLTKYRSETKITKDTPKIVQTKSEANIVEKSEKEIVYSKLRASMESIINSSLISLANYQTVKLQNGLVSPKILITDLDVESKDSNREEMEHLREEINRIKTTLLDKRTYLSSLSHIVKPINNEKNKCLRSRSGSDVSLDRESLQSLKSEMKQLKEEICNYLNLAVLITIRCENITKMFDFNDKVDNIEQEKQRLRELLDKETQEKGVLIIRLEELEAELHRARKKTQKPITKCWRVMTCSRQLPRN